MTISSPTFTRLQTGVTSADDLRVRNPVNAALAWLSGDLVTQLNTHFGEVSNSISAALAGTAGAETYVEGTFTPGVAFGGGTTGITYTAQGGTYTRIGRLVHVQIVVLLSSKGSSTGAATITGLPLTVSLTTPITVQISSMTAGVGDTYVQAALNGAATTIALFDIAAGSEDALTDADFTNTSLLRANGTYVTSA
jgi:hypothetical protein